MPKITETPEQFFDITVLFLYDMMINIDHSVLKRDDILKMIEMFNKRGLKTKFMKHYLSLDSQLRIEYKRIKEIFYNPKGGSLTTININATAVNEGEELDEDFYETKDTVRQVINLIKKQKYKKPGKLVTDRTIDRIITHVLKEKNNG